ncbi:heterocyst frequency control protein PatD [Leptolyngbya sp. AN03gr2]|uniref:heterocyst frequency control protein PatD n=1 Tax=unclassified Leptolyngbya TaxID=2650499 RepID=UPI003D310E7E
MLTENQVQSFELFQKMIADFDLANRSELHQKIRSLQKFFQDEIQSIESDEYQLHSVLVEINKQMRLLSMDGMFLQTARQADTIETRIGQIRDRIQLLNQYCSVILGTEPD